jgi:hypothetical protein
LVINKITEELIAINILIKEKSKTTFPPEMRIKFDTERDSNMNFLGLLNPDLRDQKVGMGIKKDTTYMILESKTKFDENISKVKFNLVPEIIFEK